jgi:hypothetical protein
LTPSETIVSGLEVVAGATVVRETNGHRPGEPDLSLLREPGAPAEEPGDDTTVPQRYRIPVSND